MGSLMGENRADLFGSEGAESAGRYHDPVPAAGLAVDGRGVVVEDRHTRLIARTAGGRHQRGVLSTAAPAAVNFPGDAPSRPQRHRSGGHQPGDGYHPPAGRNAVA